MASTANSSFRAALDGLVPYQPGRPIELVQRELGLTGPCVKLASNEGQYGPFPAALEAMARAAAQGNRYPDGGCYVLRTALAEQHGLDPEQIVVGNGADAVLNYLSLAMLEPGDEVAFCWPSFPVYPINAAKMGAVAVRAPLAGSSYDLDALAACVNERTKIVYVTNPNNPTGGMVGRAALERFLDGLPEHVLPVLDEAYFEYVDDPGYPDGASEHLAKGRRCVVLRTFSKIYGLAGFRVGYGLCPPDIAAACLKVKNAFDVTQSALDGALASLGAGEEVARRSDETRAGRERLAAGLRERGFEPLPAVANFVCLEVGDGAAFAAQLERKGVIVRPLGPFGDPTSVRISVGSPEELDRLFAALDAG
jgi:histidinol-phosphate aminotransferase